MIFIPSLNPWQSCVQAAQNIQSVPVAIQPIRPTSLQRPPQLSSAVTDINVTNQNHMEQYQIHTQTMGIIIKLTPSYHLIAKRILTVMTNESVYS